jgi:TBC1 domain family member 15
VLSVCVSIDHDVHQEAINPTYLLAWIPESLLEQKHDLGKFVKVETEPAASAADDEDDDGMIHKIYPQSSFIDMISSDIVFIDPPAPRGESYAFSVPVTSIYSLTVTPPTLSSWCMSAYNSISRYCNIDIRSQMALSQSTS